jgi:uncharacterized protein (TIGR00266 family)
MEINITDSPAFTKVDLVFNEGEVLHAQPKAMLCMSTGFDISTSVGGASRKPGVLSGVQSMLSGESFITVKYRAKRDGERLSLAPAAIGEVITLELDGTSGFYLAGGAYFAHEDTVTLTPKFAGMRGLMSKKGMFLVHVSGKGRVFLSSYGAVVQRILGERETLVVDNEYMLAFSDIVHYELRTISKSLKDSVFSGEGLVNRYQGPGILYYQTRARQRTGWLNSLLSVAT